jgi:murein DD-endopeptidase MepM/ murein hydrolase activator NlpD
LNTLSRDSDRGVPVYAIADGYVELKLDSHWAGNSYGQLLLKHYNGDGSVYYSGYLHMINVTR